MRMLIGRFVVVVWFSALFAVSTEAYIGSFEADDGYWGTFLPNGTFDVSKYNAGQYGSTVGTFYYPSSTYQTGTNQTVPGLWTRLQGVETLSSVNGYATGHQDWDRRWVNGETGGLSTDHGLVVTNNTAGWDGAPREYLYELDHFDLGGVAPSDTGNSVVDLSFWWRGNLPGVDTSGGALPEGYFGQEVAFLDSSGNVGFSIGLTQRVGGDQVTYWNGSSLFESALVGPGLSFYDKIDLKLDLGNDTVSASYLDFSTGTTHPLVANVPMAAAMGELSHLTIRSNPGVSRDKRFGVDDFEFKVCANESSLADLIQGNGVLCSGDKEFSEFTYHGGGDMPAAEDVFVRAITDADGHYGIRFQGAFVDAASGGASDALVDFTVTAPEGKLIKDVHLAGNPAVIGGDGVVSVTETFLPDNDQTVLTIYDIQPGSRKLQDWSDLLDAEGNLAPVQSLRVQKDILAWAQEDGAVATMSFIDQTFSQCDADLMDPTRCFEAGNLSDFDLNGDAALDANDIDALSAAIRNATNDPKYDLDDNGTVDSDDLRFLVEDVFQTWFGDSDLNKVVDGVDFIAWNNSKFQSGTTWAMGDFNGDGNTDGADFVLWNSHKFTSSTSAVPEPSIGIALLSGLLLTMRSCFPISR